MSAHHWGWHLTRLSLGGFVRSGRSRRGPTFWTTRRARRDTNPLGSSPCAAAPAIVKVDPPLEAEEWSPSASVLIVCAGPGHPGRRRQPGYHAPSVALLFRVARTSRDRAPSWGKQWPTTG